MPFNWQRGRVSSVYDASAIAQQERPKSLLLSQVGVVLTLFPHLSPPVILHECWMTINVHDVAVIDATFIVTFDSVAD